MTAEIKTTELPAIFADCVAREASRYSLDRPFRDGPYVVATDGRICVRRIDPDWQDPDPQPNTPNTAELFALRHVVYGDPVPLPDPGSVAEIACDECFGGQRTCDKCDSEYDCPACDGQGSYVPVRAIHVLDDYYLRNTYIALLLKHGVHHIRVPTPRNFPARFETDAFEGLVAPCTPHSERIA